MFDSTSNMHSIFEEFSFLLQIVIVLKLLYAKQNIQPHEGDISQKMFPKQCI